MERISTISGGVHLDRVSSNHRERFLSAYEWSLDPFLSVGELIRRIRLEVRQIGSAALEWERREHAINIYLLVCAAACTVDDSISRPRWNTTSLVQSFPRWQVLIAAIGRFINTPWKMAGILNRFRTHRWRVRWETAVEIACSMLLAPSSRRPSEIDLTTLLECCTHRGLPRTVLSQKMKIPEGFRCQDLTHEDVYTFIDQFESMGIVRDTPLVVTGLRTAGGYFAPLAAAYLRSHGWKRIVHVTIRPKHGLSRWELARLRNIPREAKVLVIDDYPNTGTTLTMTCKVLRQCGISSDRIFLLIPHHPFQTDWLARVRQTGATVIPLEHAQLRKWSLLQPESIRELLQEADPAARISVQILPETDRLNKAFEKECSGSFQARIKRVYDVEISTADGVVTRKRVLAKSVGWGWLGYHAYHIGKRLGDFVPEVIGLRDGFLVEEWLNNASPLSVAPDDEALQRMAVYVAERVRRLKLERDPRIDGPNRGWGWLEIMALLRRPYGVHLGRINQSVTFERLRKSLRGPIAVIDGKMKPQEWLRTGSQLSKVDFEHHAFGPPELDIVDPAFDLASLVFEFGLEDQAEKQLIEEYARTSGDETVPDRLVLFNLLYGSRILRLSQAALSQSVQEPLEQYRRHRRARDFLVSTMNAFCAKLVPPPLSETRTGKLLFLDVDGVLDSEIFGFPHTTVSGIQALRTLQASGIAVALNTGRSIEDVRRYSADYGLAGGVAEYGSVFYDHQSRVEYPLVDDDALQELADCRNRLLGFDGVFLDPAYRFSVRACSFSGKATAGIPPWILDRLFAANRYGKLAIIKRQADTYVVARSVDKGTGLLFARSHFGISSENVIAVGDSNEDLPMFREAALVFAPSNCSRGIKDLSRKRGWHIVRGRVQQGLLEAAVRITGHHDIEAVRDHSRLSVQGLITNLLEIAGLPPARRLMIVLKEILF